LGLYFSAVTEKTRGQKNIFADDLDDLMFASANFLGKLITFLDRIRAPDRPLAAYRKPL
jgi:hypothetical protein